MTRRDELEKDYESLSQRQWLLPIAQELISGKHKKESAYRRILDLLPQEAPAAL